MNELNISAVDATAMETATTTSAPKHKWLSKLTRGAKKATMFATVAGVMAMTCTTQAFAAGTGEVDTSSFITTACTVLKSVICLIGGGVSLWGVVNLLEGYGNDNPGANAYV
ncbi:MAG: Maff2 family mobile element protein [Ruminococcus bicirculans (ex Wegman et al. 2014)]